MANIIAVVNQKGGVGKTTTTVNITAALRALGKRVLLCDFDAQANATSGMGVDKNTASPNVYDVLINGAEPQKAVVSTKYGDVLPSNKTLAGASIEMIAIPDREHLLKNALEQLAPSYDYIFIDCPPSLEMLTVNALCAAGSLLVPVQCEYYALEGLSDLLATVTQPQAVHRGGAADHVRQPHQSVPPGGGRGQAPLPRPGLRHGDSPQRPSVRSAQPRNARAGLRPLLPRGRGLSDAGRRDLRAA